LEQLSMYLGFYFFSKKLLINLSKEVKMPPEYIPQ
jgi:hypothetical protein